AADGRHRARALVERIAGTSPSRTMGAGAARAASGLRAARPGGLHGLECVVAPAGRVADRRPDPVRVAASAMADVADGGGGAAGSARPVPVRRLRHAGDARPALPADARP